jgi:hypothetical protein
MNRALRRQQQKQAKARLVRYLWNIKGANGRKHLLEAPWSALNDLRGWTFSTPAWWSRAMMIRPARAQMRGELRRITRGADPEGAEFPDYRRPHIYYW